MQLTGARQNFSRNRGYAGAPKKVSRHAACLLANVALSALSFCEVSYGFDATK